MKQNKQHFSLVIIALKKGDESAFKIVYEENKKTLISFINSYTKNIIQTEDIVQEAFIKLWGVRDSLDEKKNVVALLHKMAYNIFIDKYRKNKREQSMLDGWLYKRLMQLVEEDDDVKKIKINLMKKAIDKLPPKCKTIFMMNKFEQLKYAEIAVKLNISIKTVESQMGKAFGIIRKEVKENKFLNLFFLFNFKKRISSYFA